MPIWVDADACPRPVKEILFNAADRTGVLLTLVANHAMALPTRPNVRMLQVAGGFDVADDEITRRVSPGDLVITADIPLAADVIARGAHALNPRGELYSADTIRGLLTMRDFMDTMRSSGAFTDGPPAYGPSERQAFASQLDRWLAKNAG
jgi:uncharacterized protein YaiI (UPF0178 family)